MLKKLAVLAISLSLFFISKSDLFAQCGSVYNCYQSHSCGVGGTCQSSQNCGSRGCFSGSGGQCTWSEYRNVNCSPGSGGVTTCTCSSTGGVCFDPSVSCGAPPYNYGICNCTTTGGTACSLTSIQAGGFCSSCTWGAWSACSVACGGGTQTRTNNCGQSQTQACNPQACAPSCGNGICDAGESSCSCGGDCPGTCGGGGGCTPSCSPSCGQGDGCGGTCSSGDAGAPTGPSNLNPVNGGGVTPVGGQVTVSWSAAPLAELYDVQVYPTGTPAGQECTAADTHCSTSQAATSYVFTVGPNTSYTWRVRAHNITCGLVTGGWVGPNNFTIGGDITGGIFLDPTRAATVNPGTGICELGGAAGQDPGPGSTITAQWGSNTTPGIITGSTYTISGVGSNPNTIVTLSPDLTQFTCSCPVGCSYSGLTAPNSGINFFLTTGQIGWWQTSNGNIYAGSTAGTSINTQIPPTCTTPTCVPALSTWDAANTVNSTGFAMTGGGSIDTTIDVTTTTSFLSQDSRQDRVIGMRFNGPRENYAFFSQLFSIGSSPAVDFTGAKPGAAPTNGRAYYAGTNTTLSGTWDVAAGEKLVIFVNGTLDIPVPITVANGGFLAFITTGNITFSRDLGHSTFTLTTPNVAGVFISDQSVIIQGGRAGGDLKFVGEGTFVGWSGVGLQRVYGNASTNNTQPTELFRYRPDFMINMPDRMKRPLYLWQETN